MKINRQKSEGKKKGTLEAKEDTITTTWEIKNL